MNRDVFNFWFSRRAPLQAPRLYLRRTAQGVRFGFLVVAVVVLAVILQGTIPEWLLWVWAFGNGIAWGWELWSAMKKDAVVKEPRREYPYRRYRRWVVFAVVIILSMVIQVAFISNGPGKAGIANVMLAFYTVISLAWLEYEIIRWFPWGKSYVLWFLISASVGAAAGVGALRTGSDLALALSMAVQTGMLASVIYVMQRLGAEDRAKADTIRDLSMSILGVPNARGQWGRIVQQIKDRLRYERVFILEPNSAQSELVIVAGTGADADADILERSLPADMGITGRAFQTGETLAWNNVKECDYYFRFSGEVQEDTRAEIAIPIQYQGMRYGVLDVQDRHEGVFSWDDVRSLEVIAHLLGAAISAQKNDLLVQEAYTLWEQLSNQSYFEGGMFQEFARFAQEKLGAELVVYFPLSPTGFPIKKPLYYGNLNDRDRMEQNFQDLESPLINLIRQWRPYFADDIYPDSIFAQFAKSNPPSFTVREQIKSSCFIPIGMPRERLGVLFLNYRRPRRFDGLFRFMILSFSQIFALLESRERYKSILFEGFGRPELGLHNLMGRYGLKKGVGQEGEKIYSQQPARDAAGLEALQALFHRVDEFLRAVSVAHSSIPPLFWRETLSDEIMTFSSTLPAGADGRRRVPGLSINPRIERESPWVKLALFRLVTEAINNAVFHGEAHEVNISIERTEHKVIVEIGNDGKPLPDDSQSRRSKRGIYSLLQDLETSFGATTSIDSGKDGTRTIVKAEIPAIPYSSGSDAHD